jgi:hypothetical protein
MRRMFTMVAATAALVVGMAIPALAQGQPDFDPPRDPQTDCLRAGQDTLRALDAFQAAAQGNLDYAPFMDATDGPIFIDAGTAESLFGTTYLPMSTVFQLHLDAPGLFAWCSSN